MFIESLKVSFRAGKNALPTLPSSLLRQLPSRTGSVKLSALAPERPQPFTYPRSNRKPFVEPAAPSSRQVELERAYRKLVDRMWAGRFEHMDRLPRVKPVKIKPLTAKQEQALYDLRFKFGAVTRYATQDAMGEWISQHIVRTPDPDALECEALLFNQVSAMAYDKVVKTNAKTGRTRLATNDELTIPYGQLNRELQWFAHPATERMAQLVYECIPEMPTTGNCDPIDADTTWCEKSDGSVNVGGWRTADRSRTEVVEIGVGDVSECKAIKPHFSRNLLKRIAEGDKDAVEIKAKIEADFVKQADDWRKSLARKQTNTDTLRNRVKWTAPEQSGLTAVDYHATAEGDAIEQMNRHNRFMREVVSMLKGWSPRVSAGLRTSRGTWTDKWCDRVYVKNRKPKMLRAAIHNKAIPAPSYRKNDAIKVWCRILDNQSYMRTIRPHAARGLKGVKVHQTFLNPTRKDKAKRAVNNLRREMVLCLTTLKRILQPKQLEQIVAQGPEAILAAGNVAREMYAKVA